MRLLPLPPMPRLAPGLLLLALLLTASAAQAGTQVTELRIAPRIDLDEKSSTFRDPMGGIAVEPPCSGAMPALDGAAMERLYLWFRLDADTPVSLSATWNHLPEGASPADARAWQEVLRNSIEVPESKGFRVWLVKNLEGEASRGRWIVTLARKNGEVICSVPFRIK